MFEGGFLGLDNIGVFDRRYPLPDGSRIEQCDGTAWMATLSLNLLQMSVSLAREEPEYTDIAERFLYDFVQLATTLNTEAVIDSKARVLRSYKNWDDEDGFYYDVIKRPDGSWEYLQPLDRWLDPAAGGGQFFGGHGGEVAGSQCQEDLKWLSSERVQPTWLSEHFGLWHNDRTLFAAVPEENLRRICEYLFDEEEFLSPHGIRSLSKYYEKNPYSFCEGKPQQRSPTAQPIAPWRCLAATPIGAGRCGCRSTTC